MFLPYLDSETNRQVFVNGEKARTWDANQRMMPGMFDFSNAPTHSYGQEVKLVKRSGDSISSRSMNLNNDIVAPSSTAGLFLVDESVATAWFHNMISGPAAQTLFGVVDSLNVDGSNVNPVVRWSTKATTALSILGGVSDIVSDKLKQTGHYDKFIQSVDQ